MPLENPDSATASLLSRARKALSGVETGAPVIGRYAKTAPAGPGVYRMIDGAGNVIYVGKARHLKKRVQSYARGAGHTNRIARMIADTASMEFVTTRDRGRGAAARGQPDQALQPALQRAAAGRQVVPLHPDRPRPPGAADPQASRRAQPQGRLFRTVRLGRRRQPHHQHAGARLPAALLLRPRVREPHAARACCTRSSAARRPAPARSAPRTTARWSRRRRAS